MDLGQQPAMGSGAVQEVSGYGSRLKVGQTGTHGVTKPEQVEGTADHQGEGVWQAYQELQSGPW